MNRDNSATCTSTSVSYSWTCTYEVNHCGRVDPKALKTYRFRILYYEF